MGIDKEEESPKLDSRKQTQIYFCTLENPQLSRKKKIEKIEHTNGNGSWTNLMKLSC